MGKVYAQLSIEERAVIQTQLSLGVRPSVIATNLNRSPSTILRELTRNSWIRPRAHRCQEDLAWPEATGRMLPRSEP